LGEIFILLASQENSTARRTPCGEELKMDDNQRQMKRQEDLTKFTLTLVFLAIFAAFIVWITGRVPDWQDFKFSALDLILLALATFRLGRMIAYDLVMEPLRSPFTQTVRMAPGR
jgi:uncharacterized membrane protein YjjP (DUF1212 family)